VAAYAAAAGIPAIVFLPRGKVSTAQLVQPIANGALVLALDTDFDGCMRIVQEVTADRTIYLANSMNSLRMEGQKTVGIELVQQFDWEVPDWIIIPAGNLGNVSSLGKGLLMMRELGLIDRLPRIACAQAAHANPLYLSYLTGFEEYRPVAAKKTLASAIQIGAPVSYERAVKVLRQFEGVVEQASEDELAHAAARADRAGLYSCPQTGVAMAALFKLVERGQVRPEHRVIVISTAHGLKFTSFKVGYHERTLAGVTARYANPPLELPADPGLVRQTIERELQRFEGA
jgi:threonine synthase